MTVLGGTLPNMEPDAINELAKFYESGHRIIRSMLDGGDGPEALLSEAEYQVNVLGADQKDLWLRLATNLALVSSGLVGCAVEELGREYVDIALVAAETAMTEGLRFQARKAEFGDYSPPTEPPPDIVDGA